MKTLSIYSNFVKMFSLLLLFLVPEYHTLNEVELKFFIGVTLLVLTRPSTIWYGVTELKYEKPHNDYI